MRVLIVDDSVVTRNRLAGLLSEIHGIEIIGEAESTEETIRKNSTLQPDIILLDLQLIDGTSFDIITNVKKGPRPPIVIVFTIFQEPPYKQAAIVAGADYFFHKPMDLAPMIETMTTLEKNRGYSLL